MNIAASIPDFDAPIVEHARQDFPLLDDDMTVGKALKRIRREGVGERVMYFYVVDERRRLIGMVSPRRTLTAALGGLRRAVNRPRIVAIPGHANGPVASEVLP